MTGDHAPVSEAYLEAQRPARRPEAFQEAERSTAHRVTFQVERSVDSGRTWRAPLSPYDTLDQATGMVSRCRIRDEHGGVKGAQYRIIVCTTFYRTITDV